MQKFRNIVWCASIPALLLGGGAMAQSTVDSFPSRPMTWIASYAAGGPNDQETRLYANKMTSLLGQQVIMDFKGGAGGTIGYGAVAKAAPDGYTLLIATGSYTIIPWLYKDLPFDSFKDFAPVTQISKRASVLAVTPSFPAKTFAEYITYARNNPDKINVGTAGAGGISHLAVALVHSMSKTRVTYVHYKGTGPVMPDLMAGRVDITSVALLAVLPLLKAGKLRALALTDDKRSRLVPEVPTVAEQGLPEYSVPNWLGFLAPAATPAAIVNKLGENFALVARAPEVLAPLEAGGSILVGNTPAQFRQFIATDSAVWKKVIQETGIKLEE